MSQAPHIKRLSTERLHLQHGPIDLVITAEGERDTAFAAAAQRFKTILPELVAELPDLRQPLGTHPFAGPTAQRMARAIASHRGYVTPMAAVAGAVADEVLSAMTTAASLNRAAVNNGGDIAIHLAPGTTFTLAMASGQNHDLGRITLSATDRIGGIATSGRHGRSLSLGIADSVTVLAKDAASADVAATLIANAVDLPGHPAITRMSAHLLDPDSDLGARLVTTGVAPLSDAERARALDAGLRRAQDMIARTQISGAALFLGGHARTIGAARASVLAE